MKEVPSQGRPRGPGGRGGIEFVADGIAVADMSRELLGHESVLVHDTPAARRIFRGVVAREVRLAGHFSRNGTWWKGVPPPRCDRKSAETIQNREDRRAPLRKRVRNLMILLDLWVCDKREKTCVTCAGRHIEE